jgi:hypothetical protein
MDLENWCGKVEIITRVNSKMENVMVGEKE